MATGTKTQAAPKKDVKQHDEKEHDAIGLLIADHKAVKALFEDFKKLATDDGAYEKKAEIAEKICDELTVHAQIEEELFYPAAREAIDDDALLDEAEVEHATAKDLIAQLKAMAPGDSLFDAKVTVLGEYIDHHVKEEQDELFPKVRATDLDLEALGDDLLERKQELKAEMGIDDGADKDDMSPPSKRAKKQTTLGVRK